MTVSSRLGVVLSALLLGLYVVADATPEAGPEPLRSERALCAEVTMEVQRSAQQGLLTPKEAQAISERCYSHL